MISVDEAFNRIAIQIGNVAKEINSDFTVVVCSERIFVDEYSKKQEEYLRRGESEPYGGVPEEDPFNKHVFVVVKIGNGQRNFAIVNSSVTISVLSEANAFDFARKLMDNFVAQVNFEFRDGIVQTYFSPSVASSQEQMYAGFRSLLVTNGNIRIPEEGLCFVQDVLIDLGDGKGFFKLPFIDIGNNYSAQVDPIAFSGFGGRTMNLNRQSTSAITISTYLWHYGDGSQIDEFSMAVLKAKTNLNKKFRIVMRTNIEDDQAEEILGERRLVECDMWATLTGFFHRQSWGDITVYSLSFTEAKQEEN